MKIQSFMLAENGWVPNNARLPVIIYSAALDIDLPYLADRFEAMFGDHGWPADWRDGIYDYCHYHSTAHEALSVFSRGNTGNRWAARTPNRGVGRRRADAARRYRAPLYFSKRGFQSGRGLSGRAELRYMPRGSGRCRTRSDGGFA
jgi:hypothetical protein